MRGYHPACWSVRLALAAVPGANAHVGSLGHQIRRLTHRAIPWRDRAPGAHV